MHLQAHAGLGWLIGASAPGADRRLRNWCVAAAVLPDVDGVTYLFGPEAFGRWHHTVGHNVFAGVLCVLAAAWHVRGNRLYAGFLTAIAFLSHLVTDQVFTEWPVYPLWPFSYHPLPLDNRYALGHPINTWIVIGSLVIIPLIALWRKVTPLDVLSPSLDRAVINTFRAKTLACATCAAPCGNRCEKCEAPLCGRHARIDRRLRLVCSACGRPPAS